MAWGRLVVLVIAVAVGVAAVDNHGHMVLRVTPESRDQLLAVHKYLEENPSLDVWAEPALPGRPVDVRVDRTQRDDLQKFFKSMGLKSEIFIRDVQQLVDQQNIAMAKTRSSNSGFSFNTYHRLNEIYDWMDALAAKYGKLVQPIDIGSTYEGRSMRGLKIVCDDNTSDRPIVFVESGIHAREWITTAAATYFIDNIINVSNPEIEQVVCPYEWHIFPSVNPDGYEYSHTTDRMWRKTRSSNYWFFRGVDANRNWPFHWNEAGSSSIPILPTYAGPSAESEVETRVLRQYLDSVANKTHVYISLHSYSQLLMFPWGWTSELTPTHADMMSIASKAAQTIKSVSGRQFTYGNIADTIYPASGSTLDYAYSKCVPYPFVFELRDTGRYGFLLPVEQIVPAANETFSSVLTIVSEVKNRQLPLYNKQCSF